MKNMQNTKLLKAILLFIILQILGWSGSFILRIYHINYINNYIIFSLYFLIISIIILYIFKDTLKNQDKKPSKTQIIILTIYFITSIIIYWYFGYKTNNLPNILSLHPGIYLLTLDYKYLITKSLEILFQQVTIWILILMLHNYNFSTKKVITTVFIIFASIHLFNYIYMPILYASIFQIGGILGGLILPYLILKNKRGIYTSYILHCFYYLISEVFLIIYFLC